MVKYGLPSETTSENEHISTLTEIHHSNERIGLVATCNEMLEKTYGIIRKM
jgi:hypothetical protein